MLEFLGKIPEALRAIIEIELTEYSKIDDFEISCLKKIKEYGFKISLDDFGSGFSSVDYMKNELFDYIKLDQSWISLVREHPNKVGMLKHLVNFLRLTQAKIVLEGVEFKQDIAIVAEILPDEVQGYLYGKPMSLSEINKAPLKNMVQNNLYKRICHA